MKKNRTAFTLIELLVVIAIIALLVSILLPSLNKAKDLAKDAVCKSSQRGIGLSLQMYSSESDGHLPQAYDGSAWDNYTRLNVFWFGKLNDAYEADKAIFNCPSASELTNGEFAPDWLVTASPAVPDIGFTPYTVSYGYNYFYIHHKGDRTLWGVYDEMAASPEDFLNPSDSIAITDSSSQDDSGIASTGTKYYTMSYVIKPILDPILGGSSDGVYAPITRHAEQTNALMLDGHVTALTPDDIMDEEYFDMK